jgi:3-deoxy-D-manno-octulosonic acid (KDO) 8-phosphate synthase
MHDVLEKLKIQLEQQEWPDVYMFKFIVPNESEKVAQVTALFNNSTDIVMHPSKTGKYISVTAKELMLDVDSILEKYEEAALIGGLIAL